MSKARHSAPIIMHNERVRIYDADNNLTLYVRVDSDGDFWLENPDAESAIWIPKRAGQAVITALTRSKGF